MHATANPELENWFARQRRRALRHAPLSDLVFTGDTLPYFLHRARPVVVQALLRATLHIVEFMLLLAAFPTVAYHAMLLRLLMLALEGSWWGATDAMRHRIRLLRAQRNLPAIQQEIAGWVTLSALVSSALLLCALLLAWMVAAQSLPFAALVAAMGVQASVRIVSRTYHSGAFALQRVFLPMEYILGPEIAVFMLGMLLHAQLGEWTVPLCILASSAVVASISFRAVRRVTDYLRVTPAKLYDLRMVRRVFRHHRARALLLPAAASLGIRMHDMLVVFLLQLAAAQELVFAMYMVMPLIRAGMGWAQAMYFDLSRTHMDIFAGFRHMMEREGLRFSMALALLFAALAALCLLMFTPTAPADVALVVVTMLASPALGFVLVSLFSRRRYRATALLCALHYALLWLLMKMAPLCIALPAPLLLCAWLGWRLLAQPWHAAGDAVVSYFPWAAKVRRRTCATVITRLAFHPSAQSAARFDAAYALAATSGSACVDGMQVLVAGDHTPDARMALHGFGYVTAIDSVTGENGRDAYARARSAFLHRTPPGEIQGKQALFEEFARRFPAGIVQCPMQENPAFLAASDTDSRRGAVQVAQKGLWLTKHKHPRGWHVTVLYEEPFVTALFLIPKIGVTQSDLAMWRQLVDGWNLKTLEEKG